MAKTTAAQKTKVLVRHQCGSCNDVFTGKICPTCGEKVNIFPINTDGIATDDVASAVGATHGLPLNLSRSPEFFDPDAEMETAVRRQMKDSIQEAQLSKAKTLAAEQAAKQLRAEETLEATKQGFRPLEPGAQQQEDQSGFASMSPGIFLQALGGWDPEQREQFLNQLASNPMLALNLSMMMNPGKAGNMNQMGMMNPMAMMGGMMQPSAEQAPPVDAATMVTAMISGMQALKEMSGGDGGGSKQMERMLDKMDDMRKETEELKLKLMESENKKTGIGPDEVRSIIGDALARNSENHANIQEGVRVLDDLKGLKEGMIGLGLMQEVNSGDQKPSIDERKLDHQIKMDEKREARDHELQLKAEESLAAKANVQSEFMSGLFAASQEQHDEKVDEKEPEKPIDVVRADARQASVIS
jgi:hypothetical protein